ncbi:hypothetical protein [Vibrio harveyi]|uniref:hypothetical protein n=1 Tax=Vibrio harveyi TaxID=669 RepID=UPI00238033A8|nr:hypothetical protein [Vibrio harveyi]
MKHSRREILFIGGPRDGRLEACNIFDDQGTIEFHKRPALKPIHGDEPITRSHLGLDNVSEKDVYLLHNFQFLIDGVPTQKFRIAHHESMSIEHAFAELLIHYRQA